MPQWEHVLKRLTYTVSVKRYTCARQLPKLLWTVACKDYRRLDVDRSNRPFHEETLGYPADPWWIRPLLLVHGLQHAKLFEFSSVDVKRFGNTFFTMYQG